MPGIGGLWWGGTQYRGGGTHGKIKLTNLIQSDIDEINNLAAWTRDQEEVFKMLVDNSFNDSGIMSELNLRRSRYYEIKKQVTEKVVRITDKNDTIDRFY